MNSTDPRPASTGSTGFGPLPEDRVADVTGWDVPPREERVAKSFAPLRGMCAGVLLPEAVVLGLSAPVLMVNGDVAKPLALTLGLGLALACVVAGARQRKQWAVWLGHGIQVIAVLLGFVVPMMFVVGGLFAFLWITAWVLGNKIAVEKQAVWTAWEREQLAQG